MKHKFAAQLYTLRKEFEKDYEGTLKKLKKRGWEAVQIDGLRGNKAEDIARVLKETDLKVAGMHISLDRMVNDVDNVINEGFLFGTKDIFCHYLDEDLQNEAGYKYTKKTLLEVAKKLNDIGFRVGYHNHEFEFLKAVEGKRAHEYLMEPVGNTFIYPEIDTYWVKYAEIDPLKIIEKYPNRIPILHLKDMKADMSLDYPESLAEIGEGVIDFLEILRWGEANGVEYYAIEQDVCKEDPFDSLSTSLKNLIELSKKIEKESVDKEHK